MKTKAPHYIHFGPAIPIVPIKDFTRIRLTEDQLNEVWSIVGPSVGQNLQKGLDLWKIIAVAYLEGLSHGSELERMNDPIKQYKEVSNVKRTRS